MTRHSKHQASFEPLLVTVTWNDPRSSHDSYVLEDILLGKGVGIYRNRRTSGYLCYWNAEYLELYSDYDDNEQPVEAGGGTAILWVLIKNIRIGQRGRVIYEAFDP